jgi:pre-mRNA-splicing factor CWC22
VEVAGRVNMLKLHVASLVSSPLLLLSRDALHKSITGIVNRVKVSNIKCVVPELLSKSLISEVVGSLHAASGRQRQLHYNTKLPMVRELLLHQLINQFRRAFK